MGGGAEGFVLSDWDLAESPVVVPVDVFGVSALEAVGAGEKHAVMDAFAFWSESNTSVIV